MPVDTKKLRERAKQTRLGGAGIVELPRETLLSLLDEVDLVRPAAEIFDDGFWRSCTGCHEHDEGHPTGRYNSALRCHVGNGCRECGGIGAVWEQVAALGCCPRNTWGDEFHDPGCKGVTP